MSFNIKTSIVIPTFQAENYLDQTLLSISHQTILPDELVISDDESTDKTIEIIRNFKKNINFKVKLVHHKRSGPTKNYLNAIQHASGDIIIVGDQDDVWLPEKIESILDFFKQSNQIKLLSHDSLIADHTLHSSGKTIRGNLSRSQSLSSRINHCNDIQNFKYFLNGGLPFLAHTLSFRKELIPYLINKPDDIDNWWFEEWLTCIAACFGRIALIPEHLVIYRQHDNQTSGGFENSNTDQNIKQNEYGLSNQSDKINKMRYCEKLILQESIIDQDKISLIKSYIQFLTERKILLQPRTSRITSLIGVIKIAIKGDYHKFAKHFFSIGIDIIKILKRNNL